ncbi:hypothetical protein [Flavihumibacter sp. CACIAM 22H1]|uniref:hypothetical protein n=1 Tax=Flavihumibacter sp. CACIAM 22H1 TaxID=1812911 RepID=UPI0007A7FD06|nr:hypothetical protein [Flavihumibacter sp. CACIAM 22H1]KYP13814.1 MAG: hypothetical protein A1D16_11390 [Flavihumibacter sp. CACIAM 22H1]
MTRAEEYANDNKIDEENIIKLEHSWVVVNNNDEENVRYSVFRQSNPNRYTALSTSPLNDDVNLSYQQFLQTNVNGEEIFNAGLPQTSAVSATSNMIQMGSKSKTSLVGIFGKVSKTLTAYGKQIRFGVTGHPDVLKKGVHLHFDEVVAKMELGLRPTQNGGIGLVQVGKLVGTADDIKRAVTLFNQAMNSAKFRTELLTRIKSAQEYAQHAFRFTKDSQLAIDKAHEFNYLIKVLEKL